ncbi:unnamed protein product, partial [Hapterophycus canaliculatus]
GNELLFDLKVLVTMSLNIDRDNPENYGKVCVVNRFQVGRKLWASAITRLHKLAMACLVLGRASVCMYGTYRNGCRCHRADEFFSNRSATHKGVHAERLQQVHTQSLIGMETGCARPKKKHP